jgi:hypothetical protein
MSDLRILYLTYDYRETYFPYPCGTNYPDVMKALNPNTWIVIYKELYEKYGNAGFHRYIENLIKEKEIDVLIFATGIDFEIHLNFLKSLRDDVLIVFYFGDDIFSFDVHYKYLAQCGDLVLTNIVFARYKYEELGIPAHFFPPAFDTSMYYPREDIERNIDVSFIGYVGNRKGRKTYLDYLEASGINLEIWGVGTANGPASQEKKMEIYCRSKINLDLTGIPAYSVYTLNHPVHQRIRHPKGRCFEIAHTKSFLLSEYAPGMEAYLEPQKEIDVFHTKEEMLEKVQFYLNHPEQRELFASRAYQRAIEKNEVYSQSKEMLQLIAEYKEKKDRNELYTQPDIYVGKEYDRNYATYRFFWFMKFIKNHSWKYAIEEIGIWVRLRKIDFWQFAYYLARNFSFIDTVTRKIKQWLPKFKVQ